MGTALRAFAHPTALQLGCALEHRDAASYSSLRGSCDEAIQSLSEEGFWIASAFAEASADKSLRSHDGERAEISAQTAGIPRPRFLGAPGQAPAKYGLLPHPRD